MANVQIPNLGTAIALNGTEQIEAVQAGTSVRITTGQMVELVPQGPQGPAGPQGEPGATGAIGPAGPAGNASNVNTVADFEASPFAAVVESVNILGYYSIGVGALTVRRVDSEPGHPWKFRSTDRYLPNGSTDNTNGGWWEGYSTTGSYFIEQFGGLNDGITDNLPAFTQFQDYVLSLQSGPYFPYRVTLEFLQGVYYFSDTIQIVTPMEFVGYSQGMLGTNGGTQLIFPLETGGIIFQRYNTYNNSTCTPNQYGPGADGSALRGVTIQPISLISGRPLIPYAYGVWARCRVELENCKVYGFSNSSIVILATAGAGGDIEGNANGWIMTNCAAGYNAGNAVLITGADVNAGASYNSQVLSAPFGFRDDSFLGNSHTAVQTEIIGEVGYVGLIGWAVAPVVSFNGNLYAIIQRNSTVDQSYLAQAQTTPPTGTTGDNTVWYYLSAGSESNVIPTWGRVVYNGLVYDVQAGQEANMWTSQPDVSPAVWGAGVAPTFNKFYIDWSLGAQMATGTGPYVDYASNPIICGPYVMGAPVRAANTTGGVTFFWVYVEGGSKLNCHGTGSTLVVGGFWQNNKYSYASVVDSRFGNVRSSGFEAYGTPTQRAILGGDSSNGRILTWTDTTAFPLDFSMRQFGTDIIFDYALSGAAVYGRFVGPTATGAYPPYSTVLNNFYANSLRVSNNAGTYTSIGSGAAAPTTGTWALGDFVHNSAPTNASGAQVLGWICTASGTPGTWRSVTATFG